MASSAYTLAPQRKPIVASSAKKLLADYVDDSTTVGIDSMHRDLALYFEQHSRASARTLTRMTVVLQVDCMLLIVEIVAWLIDLRGRR